MESLDELRQLVDSGKPAAVLYALDRWEQGRFADGSLLQRAVQTTDEGVLRRALPLLVRHLGARAGPSIVSLMSAESALTRRLATEHIEVSMAEAAGPSLRRILTEEQDVFVLASAVRAVGRLGIEPGLLLALLSHPDERVRANTVAALAGSRAPGVQEALVPLLRDGSPRVQGESLRALAGRVPGAELERFVVQRLQSHDRRVRAATAMLVADLPLGNRVGLLAPLMDDAEAVVIISATRSLGRLLPDSVAVQTLLQAMVKLGDDRAAARVVAALATLDARILPTHLQRMLPPERLCEPGAGRVMALATKMRSHWESLLPWVMPALRSPGSGIRLGALHVVLARLDYFRVDLLQVLGHAEACGSPQELALAARIRWLAGQVDALARLEAMLNGFDAAVRTAALEQLRQIPALLARQLVAQHGFAEGVESPRPATTATTSVWSGPPLHLGDVLPPDTK